ncbi:MAG: class I SAM-dependent methyltransferase [Bacteroidota bacterium]
MAEKHFYEQKEYTKNYLLPYLQKYIPNFHKCSVLEVGCAEGGLMDVLMELGIHVVGIEISKERAEIAKQKNDRLIVHVGDIADYSLPSKINEQFDVIIMREVIEHVHDKYSAFDNLDAMLKNNGHLFISFPPKYSPFAGHQQIAKSFLKVIPYLHLLPRKLLKVFASILGEKYDYVDEIKLHYSTGMSINGFEYLCAYKNFQTVKKEMFLFRPIYSLRFGLPKFRLPNIPIMRESITFGYETLLKKVKF